MSGLAEVTSPPYDVIAAQNETDLMAADPHNIVRLILPRPGAGQGGSPYAGAAAELSCWLADGVLAADPEPALYVYEQVTPEYDGSAAPPPGSIQRGLIGALGLRPYRAGVVLPHEDVAQGPVAGRTELMTATRANLEPIFLLYQGGDGAATHLVDDVASRCAPLVQARTADGLAHRLWAVTDPAQLAAVAADLAPRTALIADGHHRYAAYLRVQERLRGGGAGAGPWDNGLALLVDSAAYPPRVGAIHRVVDGLVPKAAAKLAAGAFKVTELPGGAGDLDAALAALADAVPRAGEGVAFVLAGQGRAWLVTDPDQGLLDAAVPDQPAALWQHLGGSVLADLLMGRVWGIEDDDRAVRTFHDAGAAVAAAQAGSQASPGQQATAVLCSPMTAGQVYEVAALGRRVPRKSTSFGPKPRTGFVLRTFAWG